mgnify:FL=1
MQTLILNLPSRLLRHVLVLILFYLPFLLTITNTSYATVPNNLPTTPDGSTNTRVINAANGVPVVNIAAPDASGISRNNFSDYNVNRIGQVLNNASTDVYGNGAVNTNIAGIVLTNPHLKGSAGANVILNSVTSNRITRINGFTEIAGRKADLIISNPNGIMINSGGFINTDRLSMIVGHEISGSEANNLTGNAVNSSNLYFRLTSAPHLESGFLPSLTISGDGIDLTRVDRTEFAANLIRVNRGVYAGDNKVSFLKLKKTYLL